MARTQVEVLVSAGAGSVYVSEPINFWSMVIAGLLIVDQMTFGHVDSWKNKEKDFLCSLELWPLKLAQGM